MIAGPFFLLFPPPKKGFFVGQPRYIGRYHTHKRKGENNKHGTFPLRAEKWGKGKRFFQTHVCLEAGNREKRRARRKWRENHQTFVQIG